MSAVFIHPHCLEAFLHPFPNLFCRHSHILRSEAHILLHHLSDDLVVRILEHHPRSLAYVPDLRFIQSVHPVHPDGSLGRIQDSVNVLGQRGLPGTVMSQDGDKISLPHVQTYLVYRRGNSFHVSFFIPSDIFKCDVLCLNDSHIIPFPFLHCTCYMMGNSEPSVCAKQIVSFYNAAVIPERKHVCVKNISCAMTPATYPNSQLPILY